MPDDESSPRAEPRAVAPPVLVPREPSERVADYKDRVKAAFRGAGFFDNDGD